MSANKAFILAALSTALCAVMAEPSRLLLDDSVEEDLTKDEADTSEGDNALLIKWILYASIPVVSSIVGWGTNVIALQMTFYPIKYIGFCDPYCGWQGIIPRKAVSMAGKAVDMMVGKLIDVKDIFERIDATEVAGILTPTIDSLVETIVEEVASTRAPKIWAMVPQMARTQLFKRVHDGVPAVMENVLQDVKDDVDSVFDLREMVLKAFIDDKEMLNRMFLAFGKEEFDFIRKSGFYFGFLFGLVQMVIWIFYPYWWLLPFCGLIVGYLTNVVALRCIFLPVEPMNINLGTCICTCHGLFMRRQTEVATLYGEMIVDEVLSSRKILTVLLEGPSSDKLYKIVGEHVEQTLDEYTPVSDGMIKMTIGEEQHQRIREDITSQLVSNLPDMITDDIVHYTEWILDLKDTLKVNMAKLSYAEFEQALHPVFEEDEWILILVGALLGLIVGFLQVPLQLASDTWV